MPQIFRYFLLVAAISLTAAGGVIHGRYSHRWESDDHLASAVERLKSFPAKVGNWQTRDNFTLSQPVLDILLCKGYLNRSFVNEATGETVSVAVFLGPAGPISVHNPEVCYSSRNYTMLGNREATAVTDATGTATNYWRVTFESVQDKSLLRVMFAWSTDGRWLASGNPRFEFAGQPYLYKIELASTLPAGADLGGSDACQHFLQDFVPALNQHLHHGNGK